jgi:hypothetical protein
MGGRSYLEPGAAYLEITEMASKEDGKDECQSSK